MLQLRDAHGKFLASRAPALLRFISKCRFEPETGCVIYCGARTRGRGKHVDYGYFWFDGRMVLAHRWSAEHIHGLEIKGFDVDHCCPHIPTPNTLCVEHVAAETPARNRELQTQRRMIHLQVGLLNYEDIYGPQVERDPDLVPFYDPPAWLVGNKGPDHDRDACPF